MARQVKRNIVSRPAFPSFTLPWSVFPAYRVKNEQLWGIGRPLPIENAADEPWLALEFARVSWPNRVLESDYESEPASARAQAFLAFALQHGALTRPEGAASDSALGSARLLHDLPWALRQAAVLDMVLTLNGALATEQPQIIDRQVDAFRAIYRINDGVESPHGRGVQELDYDCVGHEQQNELVQHLTATLLNPNLGGVRRLKNGREDVVFSALYQLMSSQLASWCARGDFGQCDGCGGFFPQTDGRQKYCPALRDQKESRCAMRDRSRRRRGKAEGPARRLPGELLLRGHSSPGMDFVFEVNSNSREDI